MGDPYFPIFLAKPGFMQIRKENMTVNKESFKMGNEDRIIL
jgi:hypothetical protein